MLTKLSVKNFRLLRDVSIEVTPGKPIVLIGPNGSGKSSVLQVLDMLSRWASDGFAKGLELFGGGEAVLTAGTTRGTVEVGFRSKPSHVRRYGVCFERSKPGDMSILSEWFDSYTEGLAEDPLRIVSRDMGSLILYDEVRKEITTKSQDVGRPRFSDKLSFEFVKDVFSHRSLEWLRNEFGSIHVYNGFLITPPWARDVREGVVSPFDSAVVAPVARINRRGLNLVNALFHLQNNHDDEWEELVEAFQAEFPFVQRLEFPADPAGGRIALGWRDRRYPGVRMQGHQMSEGMTSYLCLLAAILSPEPAAAIAFDEPDAHLHPSAMRRLIPLLEKASERSAIFVATHSDRLLDGLSDLAGSLRVCEPTQDGGVVLRTLDRGKLDSWRKEYTLTQIRERGHLDPANTNAGETP